MKEWCTREQPAQSPGIDALRASGLILSFFVSGQSGGSPDFSAIEPRPIAVKLIPVPALEPEMIPGPFRDWLNDISTRAWAPIEFVAVAVIVAISGLIGSRLGIKPKQNDSWLVAPNLWGMAVGPPGFLKSPMVKEGMAPLGRLAADLREAHVVAMAEWEAHKLVIAARKEAAKNELKTAAKKKGVGGSELEALAQQAIAGDSEVAQKSAAIWRMTSQSRNQDDHGREPRGVHLLQGRALRPVQVDGETGSRVG